jgi:hypothetical protein
MKNFNSKILYVLYACFVFFQFNEIVCMEKNTDELKLISEHEIEQYPHNSVLSLTSYFKVGDAIIERAGTCFSIGDGFALTSAHAVFHKGTEAYKIKVHINLHGDNILNSSRLTNSILFSPIEVEKYVYSNLYKEKEKINDKNIGEDYALIYIGENDKTSALKPIEPVYFYKKPVNELFICGYPGKEFNDYNSERDHKDANFPYEIKANFHKQTSWSISFKSPSFRGMSGSPIRFTDDGRGWKTTAILAGAYEENLGVTYGCLLTEDKINTINKWKELLLNSSSEQEFYGLYDQLSRPEKRKILCKGSPHFFERSDQENCLLS